VWGGRWVATPLPPNQVVSKFYSSSLEEPAHFDLANKLFMKNGLANGVSQRFCRIGGRESEGGPCLGAGLDVAVNRGLFAIFCLFPCFERVY
jgi:hypothetical protein